MIFLAHGSEFQELVIFYKILSCSAAKSEIIAGVVFLFVLPHPLYNHKTYFSENALLPGLVTGEFSEERAAAR